MVVGINYSPEHSGIAPYTTQACEHLASAGHNVLVLTGVPSYPSWTVSAAYRWRWAVEEECNGLRIRRLRHYVPTRQSAIRRGLYEATFGARVLAEQLPWRPDIVLAVVPSLLGAYAAARIAERTRAPLGLWIQDLMGLATKQSGISGSGSVAHLTDRLERWVLAKACGIAVINDSFTSYLCDIGIPKERITLIPNWSHVRQSTQNRRTTREQLGWGSDEFVMLHAGNMGYKQGLENVVEAARLADGKGAGVRFVLLGDGSQRQMLKKVGLGVTRLQFIDPVSEERYADVLAAADALLINERATVINMSLPSKLASYFAAGRAVVAATPSTGGTAQEIRYARAGINVEPGDPSGLLDGVLTFATDPEAVLAYGKNARQYAYDNLQKAASLRRLEHFIDDLTSDVSASTFLQ
jgi:colanic acid biosynthesis glycosyl transferase WcaI